MSALTELAQSWSRLGEKELTGVKALALNAGVRQSFPKMAAYLEREHRNELQHRENLVVRQHSTPWMECGNAELATWFHSAIAIRRACIHSNVFQEWASLLYDSVAEEMASRLTAESLFSKLIQEA